MRSGDGLVEDESHPERSRRPGSGLMLSSSGLGTKKTHLGRSGEFAALSEFLFRGYNVAIPSVDVGDDAFVINDADGTTWRIQVKTAVVTDSAKREAVYNLSRKQLKALRQPPLYFMLMARWDDRWHYVLILADQLNAKRKAYEASPPKKKRGPRPVDDNKAKGDQVTLRIAWSKDNTVVTGWNTSLVDYFDRWPSSELPEVTSGPGATR